MQKTLTFLDDEAFASNTMNGILAWTVPSAMEIFSSAKRTYTYYDFNDASLPAAVSKSSGISLVNFEISVVNSDETLLCKTKWGACRIRYDESYTPMYIDTVPNHVTFGMTIQMMLNPNRCHHVDSLPAEMDPFYYLKIGDTLTDWEGLIDSGFRLTDW
jgi:gamma-glutamyltranspeptidase